MSRSGPRKQPGGPRPKPNLELFRARISLFLTREELGDLAGISGKQVGLLERGVARYPREATIGGLSRALNKPPEELFAVEKRLRGKRRRVGAG